MQGRRDSEVVQSRDSGAKGSSRASAPAHIRLTLPHHSWASADIIKMQVPWGLALGKCPWRHHHLYMGGPSGDEPSCCLEHLCLPDCPRKDERGSKVSNSSSSLR